MKQLLKHIAILALSAGLFASCQKDPAEIINSYLKPPLADAGTPKTITLPVSFDTLRGTATSYNGPIQGYLWSVISGPSLPTIERPSSPNTRVSNMIAGIYKFQFAVIDSAGLTGVDTVSITVIAAPIQTLTLQPSANPGELSSFTNGTNPITPELTATAWTVGGSPVYGRAILKFDLSSIPAGAAILSAKLSLYSNPTPLNGNLIDANSGTANAMYIERVSSNWSSSTVFTNLPGTDAATQILVPHTNLPMLDLVDVNVTNQVSAMKTNGNYGFMIRLQNEVIYNIRDFCSSRYADAAKHPKLVITYQ